MKTPVRWLLYFVLSLLLVALSMGGCTDDDESGPPVQDGSDAQDTAGDRDTTDAANDLNGGDTDTGGDDTVQTDVSDITKPGVTTGEAISITTTSAILKGTVDPHGAATRCWFEHFISGSTVANATDKMELGSGTTPMECSKEIIGLVPGSTYYFRVRAENWAGSAYGVVEQFTTLALPEQPALTVVELEASPLGTVEMPEGFYALGSYSRAAPGTLLAAKELEAGALAQPIDFVRACAVENLWRPVPPAGYVALGLVASESKPALEAVRCVREDLTMPGFLGPGLLEDGTRPVLAGKGGLYAGNFAHAWGLAAASTAFSNDALGTEARYYRTLQTADLDGDGRDEVIGRGWNGLHVYGLDEATLTWEVLSSEGPFANAGGWDQPKYYETIQAADVDGDGKDEVLARSWGGMVVYRFDVSIATWSLVGFDGPFRTLAGWDQPVYYQTIQTADIDGDGRDELLGRSYAGMLAYHFEAGRWIALSTSGPFTIAQGWDAPEYFETIQAADIDGDGTDELLGRGVGGIRAYRFDAEAEAWEVVTASGPFTDIGGWDQSRYYRTIQTADLDGDSRAEILARGFGGIVFYRFDVATATWLGPTSLGLLTNANGWDAARYFETIQTADLDGDGRAEILARGRDGIVAYAWNPATKSFAGDVFGPPFSDAAGFGDADNYLTLQTADLDGDGKRELLVRADSGLMAYRLVGTSASWAGALSLPVLEAQRVETPKPLTAAEIRTLIADYGPVVALNGEEAFFPDDPELSLNNGMRLAWGLVENEHSYDDFRLSALQSNTTSAEGLLDDVGHLLSEVKPNPPYSGSDNFRYWLAIPDGMRHGELAAAVSVVRVVPVNHFWTELQFWIFYPFNGPGRVRICLTASLCEDLQLNEIGRHYGDWEQVTLRFRNRTQTLDAIFMSAHTGGQWVLGSDLESLDFEGSHPVVYAAKYSHAHYPTVGRHNYERVTSFDWSGGTFSVDLYDETERSADDFHPYAEGHYDWLSSSADTALEADWLAFDGKWGQYERLATEFANGAYTHTEVATGPTSPGRRIMWKVGISGEALGLK